MDQILLLPQMDALKDLLQYYHNARALKVHQGNEQKDYILLPLRRNARRQRNRITSRSYWNSQH